MPKLSYAELKDLLDQALIQFPIWSERTHYKHPDVVYIIRDLVIDEKTDSPSVVYQKKWDGTWVKFVRLASVFLEEVGEWESRFKRINNS